MDDFDTYSSISDMKSNWRFYYPWGDADGSTVGRSIISNCGEDQYYDQSQLSLLPNGILRITAEKRKDPITIWGYNTGGIQPNTICQGMQSLVNNYNVSNNIISKRLHYNSGMIHSKILYDQPCWEGNKGFTYGIFEIRCKLPKEFGAWPAFWLYSGPTEIDIIDIINKNNNADTLYSNIIDHSLTPSKGYPIRSFKETTYSNLSSNFYTYSVAWTPNKVTFFFEGREIATIDDKIISTHECPADIIANLAVTEWANFNKTHMDIDFIKVYKPIESNNHYPSYKSSSENIFHNIGKETNAVKVHTDHKSISANPNNPNEIFYRGIDNRLYISKYQYGNWFTQQITTQNSISTEPSSLVKGDVNYNPVHNLITYKGFDDQIQYFRYNNGWIHGHIVPNNFVFFNYVSSTPGSVSIGRNGDFFYKGYDSKIHQLYQSNGLWYHKLISSHIYQQNDYVLGDIIADPFSDNVFYKGVDNRIQIFWLDNQGNYNHWWVDDSWPNTAYLINSAPGAITPSNEGLYYIGTDLKIHKYSWTYNNGWQHELLPHSYGTSPYLGYPNGDYAMTNVVWDHISKKVLYRGVDGRIQQFGKNNNNWYHWWIDDYWHTSLHQTYDGISNLQWTTPSMNFSSDGKIVYANKNGDLCYFKWENCENLNPSQNTSQPIRLKKKETNQTSQPFTYPNLSENMLDIFITPNPSKGEVYIKINNSLPTKYSLYNSVGILFKTGEFSQTNKLNLTSLPKGLYYIVIQQQNNVKHSEKIILN